MTEERQRIAIAEACGYKPHPDGTGWYKGRFSLLLRSTNLPNYPADLNAMHEAEKLLTLKQRGRYANLLWEKALSDRTAEFATVDQEHEAWFIHVSATAAQRAEAFLRTIGKWEAGDEG